MTFNELWNARPSRSSPVTMEYRLLAAIIRRARK